MSGTDVGDAATSTNTLRDEMSGKFLVSILLMMPRIRYAMPGTDVGFDIAMHYWLRDARH
eukprot:1345281-Rhodomonas_salina.4